MTKGIIDIGTNTFNLLVVEKTINGFKVLYENKIPVKLGRGSMNDGILKPDAIDRAVAALKQHRQKAMDLGAEEVIAFATSAVRSAKNKTDFLKTIKQQCGLDIQIISGDREAELIYKGVRIACNMEPNKNYLILDIGGGSNEFIICNNEKLIWKKSYNLGIARMLEKIDPKDPISNVNIAQLKSITDDLIGDLIEQCKKYKPEILLGASGSFETYLSMILFEKEGDDSSLTNQTSMEIKIVDFNKLYDTLIISDYNERLKMAGLPEWRANMIVLAAVFTQHIIDRIQIKQMYFSDYSMKEGTVEEFV